MTAPLDYNPAGWWRAANSGASGSTFTATDLSGNGRHATQTVLASHPTKVYRPTGLYDWAWSFDGVNQWMLASDMLASQDAQTVIALARSGNTSLTTRRVCGFAAQYSLFGFGSQWAYYSTSGDALKSLGGNTADWTVVAVRQFKAEAVGEGYTPPRLFVDGASASGDVFVNGGINGKPMWYGEPNHEYMGNVTVEWKELEAGAGYKWVCTIIDGYYQGVWSNTPGVLGTYTYAGPGSEPTPLTISTPDPEGAEGYRDNGTYAGFWLPKLLTGSLSLAIGAESSFGGQKWVGHIADVMVFNDFLSVEAIQDIYANYFVPRYFVEPATPRSCGLRMGFRLGM